MPTTPDFEFVKLVDCSSKKSQSDEQKLSRSACSPMGVSDRFITTVENKSFVSNLSSFGAELEASGSFSSCACRPGVYLHRVYVTDVGVDPCRVVPLPYVAARRSFGPSPSIVSATIPNGTLLHWGTLCPDLWIGVPMRLHKTRHSGSPKNWKHWDLIPIVGSLLYSSSYHHHVPVRTSHLSLFRTKCSVVVSWILGLLATE